MKIGELLCMKKKVLLKNQRGSEVLTTPVLIALGTILLATLLVFSIKIVTPYIWYEKLSSTCLKYVFVMEEFGYLTNIEKRNLLEELRRQGFDENKLIISCTSKRQEYGTPIYLKVDYTYLLNLPIVGEKTIEMQIDRQSVSKR